MSDPARTSSRFVDGKSLVLDAVDLVKLVGETVSLKKAGRRYVGLCPFHQEKSPSFGVDPAKQFFYCFGCKKGGNAIDFVIERDHVEFRTALESLAEWAGIELPRNRAEPGQTDRLQRLREACSLTADLYRKLLRSDAGRDARQYLARRGFDDQTLADFGVGFAPGAWDTLAREGLVRRFGDQALLEAGLLKQGDRGPYDTFRNRVIFPIRDEQGRPIAFGGRILPGDDNPAKYLNSPETPLFSKSKVLFGLDLAKKAIVSTKTAVVFEGYADAAMAHQHGITNAVAVLGTALTQEHANVLRRFADRIVLVFDADAAGGMATRRSVELFLREPVEVAIAELPAGTDPDEFLQEHGADAFRQRIERASDAISFQWSAMIRRLGANPSVTEMQASTKEFLSVLDGARREVGAANIDHMRWGAILARVSRLTGIPGEELRQRFEGPRRPPASPKSTPYRRRDRNNGRSWKRRWEPDPLDGPRRTDLPAEAVPDAAARTEQQLLGALFNDPSLWERVQAHVSPADFSGRQTRWMAERFWEILRNEGEPTFAAWLDEVSQGVLSAGGNPASAARAKEACIQWAQNAEALGKPAEVASAAVAGLARRRGSEGVNELLAALRRNAGQQPTPQGGDNGADAGATAGATAVDDAEAQLLRQLQERLGKEGRTRTA